MQKKDAVVSIVMGSDSDLPVMKGASDLLNEFGIENETIIASAHRAPEMTSEYAGGLRERGVKVVIAAAGYAAHLSGVIASKTTLPVIGVPLDSSPLMGFDALFSMVQMPSGVPVATVTVGKAGAKNAALLAAEILSLSDAKIAEKIDQYRQNMANKVEEKNRGV